MYLKNKNCGFLLVISFLAFLKNSKAVTLPLAFAIELLGSVSVCYNLHLSLLPSNPELKYRKYKPVCPQINWGIFRKLRLYLSKKWFELGSIQFSRWKGLWGAEQKTIGRSKWKRGSYTRPKSRLVIAKLFSFRGREGLSGRWSNWSGDSWLNGWSFHFWENCNCIIN